MAFMLFGGNSAAVRIEFRDRSDSFHRYGTVRMPNIKFLRLVGVFALICANVTSGQVVPGDHARLGVSQVRQDTMPLRRRVSLEIDSMSVIDALVEIRRQTGVMIGYATKDLKAERMLVAFHGSQVMLGDAVNALLVKTPFEVVAVRGGNLSIKRRALVRISAGRVLEGTGAIVGRVTDAKTGEGLKAAEVFLENTRWRAITDSGGAYRIAEVDSGSYTFTVRRLGYVKSQQQITVRPNLDDTVNVALTPRPTRLDELVTTATGQQRRRQIASDVTVLRADSIVQTQPVKSVTDILDGRVPGLSVQRTSGAPGDPARLRLRGASSPVLNNDPIVVVDGMRVYAEQSAARSANLADRFNVSNGVGTGTPGVTAFATPSPLDGVDPNSIETIEVVKGPSAATLYGQDAANGVILITTKKGKAGPTRWTVGADHGVTEMIGPYPERMLRWGHALYDQSQGSVVCPISNVYGVPTDICAADSIIRFQMLNDPALTVFGRGNRTATTLGVSGGSSSITYNVTGSYSHEVGLLRLPDYEVARYQAQLNTTLPAWMRRPQNMTQWGVTSGITARLGATADLSLHTSLSQTDQQRSGLERQLGDLDATYLDRVSGIYYEISNVFGIATSNHTLDNYYTKVTAGATQLTTGVALNWRPWPWLMTNGNAGIDVIQRVDALILARNASPGADSTGRLNDGRGKSLVHTLNLGAVATRPLGLGFNLRFAAGANYTAQSTSDLASVTQDIPAGQASPGLIQGTTRAVQDRATFGWYVEPALNHRRFSLSSGLRLDGGSSYGSRLSLPTFPKLGFTYLLSDEPFFPFKDVISSFQLRLSYGRASRQPGPVDRLRLYNGTTLVLVDGQFVSGVDLATIGNTDLRPERSTEIEGGFDTDLFDSRVTLGVTGYRKTTDDALLATPLPPSIASGSIIRNIGMTRNTGLDLTVGAQLLRSTPVTWTTQLALSHRRDEVVKLGPGVEPFYIGNASGQRVAPGYPLFGSWALPVVGYADVNGDGVIEKEEIVLGDTAVYRGSPLPDYTASLQMSVALWQGVVAVTADLLYDHGLTQHTDADLITRLVGLSAGQNDPNSSPAEQATVASAALTSYYWHQTTSTTRLNSLAVAYKVPSMVARWFRAQRVAISLQGSNLGLWTNYRGVDPNVNAASTGNELVDNGVLPRPRTWQVRVNATY